MKSIFDSNCKGQEKCVFKEFNQFIKNDTNQNHIYLNDCLDSQARIFFQFTCKQTESQLADKNNTASFHIFIEIVSAIVIMLFSIIGRKYTLNFAQNQDKKVVSLTDYTLFFKISSEQNKVFKKAFYNSTQKDASRG